MGASSSDELTQSLHEGWEDTVAAVVSLVVQHCPGDPRDTCRLLQLSTACRAALQRVKGHCIVIVNFSRLQKLRSYVDWAAAHSSLVQHLAVDITVDSYIHRPDQQLGAAIAALRSLKSFKLTGRQTFDRHVLGGLSAHTQLTRVDVNVAAADAISCLPASVVAARLVVDVSAGRFTAAYLGMRDALTSSLSFQHFPVLRSLSVTLWAAIGAEPQVEVVVPPQLTQLRVSGGVTEVKGVKQRPFDRLETFAFAGCVDSVQADSLAQVVARMPRLRELCVDGVSHMEEEDDSDSGWNGTSRVSRDDMCVLATAIGAASQLTSLIVLFEWGDSYGFEGVWAEHLQRLTALQCLNVGFELADADVAAIATLTQLTALRLSRCGHGVPDQEVQDLCSALTRLWALTIEGSGAEDCDVLLGAVAQLTKLSVLSLGDNNCAWACGPGQLELLWPLVQLQRLVLPPAAEEDCNIEESIECLFEHMPVLTCVRSCDVVYGPEGAVP